MNVKRHDYAHFSEFTYMDICSPEHAYKAPIGCSGEKCNAHIVPVPMILRSPLMEGQCHSRWITSCYLVLGHKLICNEKRKIMIKCDPPHIKACGGSNCPNFFFSTFGVHALLYFIK